MFVEDLFNCPEWLEKFYIDDKWRNAKVIIGDNSVKFELDTNNYLLFENDEFKQYFDNIRVLLVNEEMVIRYARK